jgi:hypothetical protein
MFSTELNQFGVCRCDEVRTDSYGQTVVGEVRDLIQFGTDYGKARAYYLDKVVEYSKTSYALPNDLWVVIINDGKITQFEQLTTRTKTVIVDLKDVKA